VNIVYRGNKISKTTNCVCCVNTFESTICIVLLVAKEQFKVEFAPTKEFW